jgi:hypothetical protein
MSRRRAALSGLALVTAVAFAADAVIPSESKIATAVAQANAAAGRGEPLWLDILLRIGEGEPAAKGVLTSHPTGLARLELENTTKGFVERHLLQGSTYRASRNGEPLDQPLPFLPPFFLLQMRSGDALEAALASFGIADRAPHLARLGDLDCWVLGAYSPNAVVSGEGSPATGPAIWIDSATRQILRLDRGDGVRLDFGPEVAYEKIRVPSWIAINVEGRPPARLEIQRVSRANAPAAAFSNDWLSGR